MLTLPRLPTAVFELHKNSSRRFEYTFDVLGIAQFHCDPHPEWEKELPLGSPHWQTSRRGPRVTPGRPPTATAAPARAASLRQLEFRRVRSVLGAVCRLGRASPEADADARPAAVSCRPQTLFYNYGNQPQ